MNKQSARRCQRLEKLMASGLLVGLAQRVKACFEYLDSDNTGHFTLKDVTEHGKRISHDLGIEVESASSFAVMDAFRSFDISGRGRVRLEDFAISLVIRFQKHEYSFFEEQAGEVAAAGIYSVSDLMRAVCNPSLEGAFVAPGEGSSDSETVSRSYLSLPTKFHESFRSVYYLMQQRLKKRPDDSLSPEDLAKLLKDTYIDASRELRAQLHLPMVRIKAAWREFKEKGPQAMLEGLEEDLEDTTDTNGDGSKRTTGSRRRQSNLFWKPPKKSEYGASRRMSFEMTQASSLKAQARRSSSILAGNGSGTPAYAGDRRGGGAGGDRDPLRHSMEGGWADGAAGGFAPYGQPMGIPFGKPMGLHRQGSLDVDYSGVDTADVTLSAEQTQLLHSALRCIDNFMAIQSGRPYEALTDEEQRAVRGAGGGSNVAGAFSRMRAMSMLGGGGMMRRDSFDGCGQGGQRFSVLSGVGYRNSMLMQMGDMLGEMNNRQDEGSRRNSVVGEGQVHVPGATVEAELSQELMETQDILRRTLMRLEVLELIQLQVESLEEETNVEVTEGKDTSEAEGKDLGGSVSGAMQAIVVPENVAFEDIMDTAQELRVLVSKRGMDSMLVGALLNTPTALLPLQDIEDNSQQDSSEKDSSDTDSKAGENSHPNSPMTPSSAVKIRFVDQKRGKKESVDGKEKKRKKLMQTTALIESMEATAKELAEQLKQRETQTEDLNKLELLKHLRDEKTAENIIIAEQEHREKEGAAAVAVEVQVLRDRIHTVDFVEQEVTRMKTKNVELGRRVKQLERELMETQEERDFGKVDSFQVGAGGMTVSEEQVMKLKDEIADLRSANSRLLKEQQHRGIAAKHAEQRLKMCLQDNLALHQKLNRVEEELNSSRTEVSDLLGQIEHQRDIEEERLQVARKLHSTEMLVTELRGNLLEARAEAVQAGKLREELTICESRVAKLMTAASEAEVEGEGRLSSKQEVEELRAALQQKTRENRDLTISVRSLERKASEVKAVHSRLEACQDEVNRYKVRVEQSAPMLAEVARLRGASRAAVRSLQEQDKIIATLEENNKLLRTKVTELTERTKNMENMEVTLQDSEAECTRLSEIVSNDIPILKEKLKAVQEERRQLEIQCRQIKKSGRQFAIVPSGSSGSISVGAKMNKPGIPTLSSTSSDSKK